MRILLCLVLFALATHANEESSWEKGYEFGKKNCFMIGDAGSGGTRLSLHCMVDGKPQAQPVFVNEGDTKFVCSGLSTVGKGFVGDDIKDAENVTDAENVELYGLSKSALGLIDKIDEQKMKNQSAAVATLLIRRCVWAFMDPDPSLKDMKDKKPADYLLLSKIKDLSKADDKKQFVQGVMYAVDKPVLATAGQRLSDNMDEDAVSKFYAAFRDAMKEAVNKECVPKTEGDGLKKNNNSGGDKLKPNNKQGDISAMTMSGTWEAYLGFWAGWETFDPKNSKIKELKDKSQMIFSEAGGASLQFGFTVPPEATSKKPMGAASSNPRKGSSKKGSPKKSRSKKGSPKKGSSKKGSPKKSRSKKGSPKKGRSKKGSPKKGSSKKGSSKKGSPKKGGSNQKTMQPNFVEMAAETQALSKGYFEQKYPKQIRMYVMSWLGNGFNRLTMGSCYQAILDFEEKIKNEGDDKPKQTKTIENPCLLKDLELGYNDAGKDVCWLNANGMDKKVCADLSNGQGQKTYQDKIMTRLRQTKMVGTGDIKKCKDLLDRYMQHDDETNYPKEYTDPVTNKKVAPAGGDKFFGDQFNDLTNALRPKLQDKEIKELFVVVANAGLGELLEKHVNAGVKSDGNLCVKGKENMQTLFETKRPINEPLPAVHKADMFAYNIPMAQAYYWLLMEKMGLMEDRVHFCPKRGLEWTTGLASLLAAKKAANDNTFPKIRQYLPNVKLNERPDDILGVSNPKAFHGVKGPK